MAITPSLNASIRPLATRPRYRLRAQVAPDARLHRDSPVPRPSDSIGILATLGFLGFGIQPPATDWGSMLSNGLIYVNDGYWWLIYP